MAKQSLSTIKNWFKTNLKPTQAQFWDTWDSFWHKDEKIPTSSIEQLDTILGSKASREGVDNAISELNSAIANIGAFCDTRDIMWNKGENIEANTIGTTESFLTLDNKIVTVSHGLIKSIVHNTSLQLTFDNIANAPVADVASVTDWNDFFDLPIYGEPFISVEVTGNVVDLKGGYDITLKQTLFIPANDEFTETPYLLKVIDTGCVVTIEDAVFRNSINLIEVSFPACTKTRFINGHGAFSRCLSLVFLSMPMLTDIGAGTFSGCAALSDLSGLPLNTITRLNDYVFGYCTSLTSVNMPIVELLGKGCFSDCSGITSFDMPLLNEADYMCFSGCNNMVTFNFPELVTAGAHCFSSCLKAVNFNLPKLETAGDQCFYGCESMLAFSFPSLITAEYNCFYLCSKVTTFNLPLLETIGYGCFVSCAAVTVFDLPSLVTAGNNSFDSCTAATTFILPKLETAGDQCFLRCTAASIFNIPECVDLGTTVGNDFVFNNIFSKNISLKIPSALMTCNGGNPDGDIQYLQANNTVTITIADLT